MKTMQLPPKMKNIISLFSFLFILPAACILCNVSNAQAYEYPIGIPDAWIAPDTPRPARPNPWTSEQPGYYYINYQTGSDSRTYGTPSAPRATIPDSIPAGSYVEIQGTYSYLDGGASHIHGNGTAQSPVWVVGSDTNRPTFIAETLLEGEYLIVDNCNFTYRVLPFNRDYPANYIMLRNSDISAGGQTTGTVGIGGTGTNNLMHDFIIYNNKIHDTAPNWDNPSTGDVDAHGIKPEENAYNIWIIDNYFYNIAGNAIQVGNLQNSADYLHHIYIGKNEANGTRQSAIGMKKSSDVIISQNTFHNSRGEYQGNSDSAGNITYQYSPRRLWIIYNNLYDSDGGIIGGSDYPPNSDYIYIIGNEIHDIHDSGYKRNNDAWTSGAGMQLVGGIHVYVINNTITDTDVGIATPKQDQYLYIENNIISNIASDHIRIQYENTASNSTLKNNIINEPSGNERIRWGSDTQHTLASLPVDINCSNLSPAFASENNFHILSNSPAKDTALINTALTVDVYQEFQSRYGRDIRVDRAKIPRPQGATFDIGAYEYDEGYEPPPSGGLNPPAGFSLIQ